MPVFFPKYKNDFISIIYVQVPVRVNILVFRFQTSSLGSKLLTLSGTAISTSVDSCFTFKRWFITQNQFEMSELSRQEAFEEMKNIKKKLNEAEKIVQNKMDTIEEKESDLKIVEEKLALLEQKHKHEVCCF